MGKNTDFIIAGLLLLVVGCSQSGTPHNAKPLYMRLPEGAKLLDTGIGRMQSSAPVEWIINTQAVRGYDKQLFVPMVISKGSLSFSLPSGEQKIILLPDAKIMLEVGGEKYGPYVMSGEECNFIVSIREEGMKISIFVSFVVLPYPYENKKDKFIDEGPYGTFNLKNENKKFKILIEKSEDFEGKIGPSKYYTPIWR